MVSLYLLQNSDARKRDRQSRFFCRIAAKLITFPLKKYVYWLVYFSLLTCARHDWWWWMAIDTICVHKQNTSSLCNETRRTMEESQRCNPLQKLCIAMRREPNFRPPQKIPNYKAKLDGCTYSQQQHNFSYTVNRDPKCVDIITRIGRTDGAPFFFFRKARMKGGGLSRTKS